LSDLEKLSAMADPFGIFAAIALAGDLAYWSGLTLRQQFTLAEPLPERDSGVLDATVSVEDQLFADASIRERHPP
jgi:hypothetical protein